MSIPDRSFTVIVGPNACGKSTLLRGLARLLPPSSGQIVLDGADIHTYRAKEVARRIGLLPQSSTAPDGITAVDLADERAVLHAMEATSVRGLSGRLVDELSGGQRQRVWVAMALAHDTGIMLIDEPTTFMDITHQIELLELFTDLNLADGRWSGSCTISTTPRATAPTRSR